MFRNFAVEAVKLWDFLSCKGNTVNATYPRQIDQCEQSKSCLRTEAKGITSPVIPSYLPSPWLSNKCGLGCLRASIGANIFFLLLIICYVKRYLIKSWFHEVVYVHSGKETLRKKTKHFSVYSRPTLNQWLRLKRENYSCALNFPVWLSRAIIFGRIPKQQSWVWNR